MTVGGGGGGTHTGCISADLIRGNQTSWLLLLCGPVAKGRTFCPAKRELLGRHVIGGAEADGAPGALAGCRVEV